MKRFFLILFTLIAILIGVLLFRAFTLDSKQIAATSAPAVAIDRDAAITRLSQSVQIRTVSSEPFDRLELIAWLMLSYPRVHATLHRELVGHDALLYTWPGSDPALPPLLLMGHYDTVPVEPAALAKWTQPPFSGAVVDGFIWGRGTLDDKLTVI